MNTTQVKGSAGPAFPGLLNSATSPKVQGDLSFQDIFSSQTKDSDAGVIERQNRKGTGFQTKDQLAAQADRSSLESGTEKLQQKETEDTAPEDKDLEACMAVLASSVTELVKSIADTFQISAEDVEQLMTDLNLTATDLLDGTNLSNLILAAAGEQDSLSLLTNQELYESYQMLMAKGTEIAEQCSGLLNVSIKDLQNALEQLTGVQDVQNVEESLPEQGRQNLVEDGENGFNRFTDETPDNMPQVTTTGTQPEKDGQKGQKQDAGSGENNLFMENLLRTIPKETVEGTQESFGTADVDVQDVMKQILDYMKVQLKPDASDVEMQLHPASLGTLQIHIAAKDGVLSAHFVTQNETVKAALESQMVQLKEQFEQQGVKVEAIEVTVQTHHFEQNLEQGRGRQPQESLEGKKPRIRKITLSEETGELPQDLEQEDRLVAEMMASNGTTVDYTA